MTMAPMGGGASVVLGLREVADEANNDSESDESVVAQDDPGDCEEEAHRHSNRECSVS